MKKIPLAVSHPDLASQLHPSKNVAYVSAETISAKFNEEVWWVCPCGHEWREKVSSRARQKTFDCKICCSLLCTHPELAKELHSSLNEQLKAENITAGSSRKIWWICPNRHEYEATVKNRAKNGSNCPHCQKAEGVTLSEKNSLAAKMFHPTKNRGVTADQISIHSKEEMWFQCDKGHEWKESVKKISKRKHKICLVCSSLGYLKSQLLETWDPQNELSPFEISANSNKKVWWLCPVCRHRWLASVANRFRGSGCPCCSGSVATKEKSLAVTHQEIAVEWDYGVNQKTPNDVTTGSDEIVSWICKNGHRYKESIYNRTKRYRECQECKSLAYLCPDLIEELHPSNGMLPRMLLAGSGRKVIWQCKKCGHIWESKVVDRYHGHGCPNCHSGWTVERLKRFIVSILPFLHYLKEAEIYLLCLRSGLLEIDGRAKGKALAGALSTGKFPVNELEKFVKNEISLVDHFLDNPTASLEASGDLDIEAHCVSEEEIRNNGGDLPIIQAKDILSSVDHTTFSSFGEDDVQFFIKSAVEKLWQHVFVDESTCIAQVDKYKTRDGLYSCQVKAQFLKEYHEAKSILIPKGYSFSIEGEIQLPNLMQLHTAYLVKERKRIGNWSGTGAGKTLAAVLASKVIDAKLTIICCPNNVVEGWKKKIKEIYPDSHVFMKKDIQCYQSVPESKPHYFILNYEYFQSKNGKSGLSDFLEANQVDFVVIDEIHFSKQRDVKNVSIRKRVISAFLEDACRSNNNLHVLGMSATPVINNLFEGKTLLELVTGKSFDMLQTKATVPNCVALHQQFVLNGMRYRPQYGHSLKLVVEKIDCSSHIPEVRNLGLKPSTDEMDGILTRAKIPYILDQIRHKTLIYVHFWNKNGVFQVLKKEIEKKGWRVASFTGESKEGLIDFVEGDADVLIASSCIGTGVDGIQRVCSRMIVASLPWTHAEFEQLQGRVYRQGQKSNCVEIFVPLTYATVNGNRWSYCESRWDLIKFKKSVADASVDGIIPAGHLPTQAQVLQAATTLLHKLSS